MRKPNSKVDALVQSWLKEYSASGVNAADFVCDRHARVPDKVALFYENAKGESAKWTFREIMEASSKLAGFLKSIGVRKGDRVGVMLPKTPELIISALATWRLGAAYLPLFTAFGPDAVDYRMLDSDTRVVLTNAANRAKLGATSAYRDGKLAVVTVCEERGKGIEKGDYSFWHELGSADAETGLTRHIRRRQHDYALHLRDDRQPQGGGHPGEMPCFLRSLHEIRPGPSRRRHVLEYGRPGLGLRPLLQSHRSAAHGQGDHVFRCAVHSRVSFSGS